MSFRWQILWVFVAVLFAAGHAGLAQAKTKTPAGIVDLNNADLTELTTLPGIGKSRAEAIIQYRAKRPFARPAQLLRIKGIGQRIYAKLKPLVTVTPPRPKAASAT
jgi:competence protein ComEA